MGLWESKGLHPAPGAPLHGLGWRTVWIRASGVGRWQGCGSPRCAQNWVHGEWGAPGVGWGSRGLSKSMLKWREGATGTVLLQHQSLAEGSRRNALAE